MKNNLLKIGFLAALLWTPATSAVAAETPPDERPNVVLISIDTLRYDHLGCYGYKRDTSPNIDRLAKSSVVFDNFITQANLTPISQMSLFTSQYPRTNGMVDFVLDKEEVTSTTLPEILKIYGYFNAAFSSAPEFNSNVILKKTGTPLMTGNFFSQHFDVYKNNETKRRDLPQNAIDWITKNTDKRFFLWIPIGTVHWPYAANVPEDMRSRFDPKNYASFFMDYGGIPESEKGTLSHSALARIFRGDYYLDFKPVHHLTKKDNEFIIARYDAGIYYTDEFIGRLMDTLEKNRLIDNTIIILHSIHGEDLGEHGYYQHYDLYDTEVKNALIIKFPENRFNGRRVSDQVQGIDVVPTLLEYLGIPRHHNFQGRNLMPLLTENLSLKESEQVTYITRTPLWEFMLGRWLLEIFSEDRNADMFTPKEKSKKYGALLNRRFGVYPDTSESPYDIGLRTPSWKLILRKNKALQEEVSWWGFISNKQIIREEIELYDLKADPYEKRNVAAKHPDVVDSLKNDLQRWDDTIEKHRSKPVTSGAERMVIPYP